MTMQMIANKCQIGFVDVSPEADERGISLFLNLGSYHSQHQLPDITSEIDNLFLTTHSQQQTSAVILGCVTTEVTKEQLQWFAFQTTAQICASTWSETGFMFGISSEVKFAEATLEQFYEAISVDNILCFFNDEPNVTGQIVAIANRWQSSLAKRMPFSIMNARTEQ